MTLAEGKAAVLQMLSRKGWATESALLRAVDGDDGMLKEICEELIMEDLAEEKKGKGLTYIGPPLAGVAEQAVAPPKAAPGSGSVTPEGATGSPPTDRVFISYARADASEFVRRLAMDLEQRGQRAAWLDVEDIGPGDRWDVLIERGIATAPRFAAVVTRRAVEEDSVCRAEIIFALNEGRSPVPLRLDPDLKLPLLLAQRHWVDFTASYERGVEALLRYLAGDPSLLREPPIPRITGKKPIDFGAEIAKFSAGFTGRRWLTEKLDHWLTHDSRRAFVLVAMPGVGKSAIAAWLSATRDDVVAVHFCTEQKAASKDPQEFVRALVAQLSARIPAIAPLIVDAEPEKGRATASEAFRDLVVEPTGRISPWPPTQPKVIIVDSLDEAATQKNETVLDVLMTHVRDLPPWLRIFTTTRPETPILRRLEDLNVFRLDADQKDNRRDLHEFIEARLAQPPLNERVPHRDEVLARLEELAEGNFRYASMVLDALDVGSLTVAELGRLTPGLEVFYHHMFSRQFADTSDFAKRYAPLLQCFIAAQDPLPFGLLRRVTVGEDGERRAAQLRHDLDGLGSCLRVIGTGMAANYALGHSSLRDWMTDPDAAGDYWCPEEDGQKAIAEACWAEYLGGVDGRSEYTLQWGAFHLRRVGRLDDAEQLSQDRTVLDKRGDLVLQSVYISYARTDDESFVRRLCEDLTYRGFDVWWDRISMPSRALTFLQEIRDAISSRDRLVLVVGPDAIASEYVEAEWRFALDLGKSVNPVLRLGEYDTLPDELKLLDAPDFRDDAHYQERLETLVRQLSEPVPPMGKLVGVPSLPQHLLKRADRLRALKDAVLADVRRTAVVTGEPARVGVHGMGGIGKSVLATMLARDTEVRRMFPDGVIWVPVGQTPNLVELQRTLAKVFDDPGNFDNVGEGKAKLSALLADRTVLLVLDDVWEANHAEALDCQGPRCRMVFTSRDAGIVTALGGTENHMQLLTEAEARDLLAEWAGLEVAALPEQSAAVMEHCGRLPLALSLCGGMVRDGESWDDLLEALAEADLQYLDHPHGNMLRSVKVSVDSLTPDEAQRFAELRVFPADENVPEAAITALWSHTGGLTERRARGLLGNLERRALVQLDGVSPQRQAHLHALVRDYTRQMVDDDAVLHNRLLDAYRSLCPDGWASGPNDGYFLQRVVHHLIAAGRREEVLPLLTEYRFLDAKLRSGGVQSLIEDYERGCAAETGLPPEQGASLRLIAGALRLSSHVLSRDPDQLGSQLGGRLRGFETPDVQALVRGADEAHTAPWLQLRTASLTPPGGPLLRTLSGHQEAVTAVAVTGDGRLAISASGDDTLKVWDMAAGTELRTLSGHTDEVSAVALTPDGRRAVSSSADRTLKVWDLNSGAELRTLTGHSSRVNAVAVTADGGRAVSASGDQAIKVWDLESGAALCTLNGHSDTVYAVAVTPDGRQAVSGSLDRTLKVWDLESGAELRTLCGHGAGVTAVAISPDGRLAISASADRALKVWDLALGVELLTLVGHSKPLIAVAMTADGRQAISASADHSLKVWDLATGAELRTLSGHSDAVSAVAVSPDGSRAVSASWDRTLKVWDLVAGQEMHSLGAHSGSVRAVAVTPDGRRAVSASEDQTLKVWDLAAEVQLRTLSGHRGAVNAVAATADGCRAVSASHDQTLKVWDLESGVELRTLVGHSGAVRAAAVTADGRRVVSASEDGTVKVWELESGAELCTLIGHRDAVSAVAVTADGRRAISASRDDTLRVWDLVSGAELRTLARQSGRVAAVAATPDGRCVITALGDGTLELWDIASGAELRTLRGHGDGVNSVACAAGGHLAISVSQDETLKVWNLDSGMELCTFSADARLLACAAAPDGVTVVAGDTSGNVHFLHLQNVASGPWLCTAWLAPGSASPAFGCRHCRAWSEVPPSALGTELPCPHCGKPVKLTPFVIEAEWRSAAAAWGEA